MYISINHAVYGVYIVTEACMNFLIRILQLVDINLNCSSGFKIITKYIFSRYTHIPNIFKYGVRELLHVLGGKSKIMNVKSPIFSNLEFLENFSTA